MLIEKEEKLQRLIRDLQDALEDGAVIVVEGPHDARALRELGIHGRVEQLSKRSYTELVESLTGQTEVILLTDYDTYGEKAARELRNYFSNECVRVNLTYRERFKKLTGFIEFEDVPTLIENDKKRVDPHGKNLH